MIENYWNPVREFDFSVQFFSSLEKYILIPIARYISTFYNLLFN